MKKCQQRSLALAVGIAIGAAGWPLARAAAPPPACKVIEYEIPDREAFQANLQGADGIPASRVFLARHAKGTALAGEPPRGIGILKFPSLAETPAFDRSPQYPALLAARGTGTKWHASVVDGPPQ